MNLEQLTHELDQFLAGSETKWGQPSSLVLLLPHGHEGQGPEHSSARIERFLSLCAEENLRLVNPSTPASYFHLLRLQARDPIEKLLAASPGFDVEDPLLAPHVSVARAVSKCEPGLVALLPPAPDRFGWRSAAFRRSTIGLREAFYSRRGADLDKSQLAKP